MMKTILLLLALALPLRADSAPGPAWCLDRMACANGALCDCAVVWLVPPNAQWSLPNAVAMWSPCVLDQVINDTPMSPDPRFPGAPWDAQAVFFNLKTNQAFPQVSRYVALELLRKAAAENY